MRHGHAIGFTLLATCACAGCGGAAFATGAPWDPKESRFFDDGVDVIDDMKRIDGEFAYRQEDELTGRVNLADLIAEVEIATLQTTRDMDGGEQKRMDVRVVTTLYGGAPAETITFASGSQSPGHGMILRYEDRLSGRFLAFVRWFEDDRGRLAHHFHLSPASEAMKADVQARIERRVAEDEKAARAAKRGR
ncbi:MAG: hypothetical protein PHU25_17085 [Deltaproteobacteria bacterium]|nr:hypothetical protein [Deltaproteobacteria bacterium]